MFNAQFSEFSYGYAITDNILHSGLPSTPHAPVFPSLYAEGSSGGGYDVKIPTHPVPVFLQFKIPQVMRRSSSKMPNTFSPPYLRMHLRTKRPNQHRLLQRLEDAGNVVYYATPDFWLTQDLDDYFWNQRVQLESWYIPPSAIGPLDTRPHHVAYERGNPVGFRCSDPEPMEGRYDAKHFGSSINRAVRQAPRREATEFFESLASQIRKFTRRPRERVAELDLGSEAAPSEKRPVPERELRDVAIPLRTRRAGRQAAYLAQVRLSSTLIVTGRDE